MKTKPRGTLPPRNLKEMEEPTKRTGEKMARGKKWPEGKREKR